MVQFVELPYKITEKDPDVTLSQNTANKEDTIITYRVPKSTAIVIPKGAQFTLIVKDSTGAQITEGLVRMYKVDPSGAQKLLMEGPIDINQLAEIQDKNKIYTVAKTIKLFEDEYLIITFESSKQIDISTYPPKLILEAIRVIPVITYK